jgi:hypothetical protein
VDDQDENDQNDGGVGGNIKVALQPLGAPALRHSDKSDNDCNEDEEDNGDGRGDG